MAWIKPQSREIREAGDFQCYTVEPDQGLVTKDSQLTGTPPTASDTIPDCETCGGCCAYSCDWPAFIGDRDGDGIPDHLIDHEEGRMRCDGNRCAALAGSLGVEVYCTVYANRPLVCMEFVAGSDGCHAVRRHFGFEDAPAG